MSTYTAAKKAYRQRDDVKKRDAEYQKAYRQRPDVKARERARAQKRRAAPGGAELNKQRVEANRAALGRNYLSQLISQSTGVACRDIPDDAINIKRQALLLKRMATNIVCAIAARGKQDET